MSISKLNIVNALLSVKGKTNKQFLVNGLTKSLGISKEEASDCVNDFIKKGKIATFTVSECTDDNSFEVKTYLVRNNLI